MLVMSVHVLYTLPQYIYIEHIMWWCFLTWCEISAVQLALGGGDGAHGRELDEHQTLEHLSLLHSVQEVHRTVVVEPCQEQENNQSLGATVIVEVGCVPRRTALERKATCWPSWFLAVISSRREVEMSAGSPVTINSPDEPAHQSVLQPLDYTHPHLS